MRSMIATLPGLVALTSVSAQAAPLPPAKATPVELGAAPLIERVRQGCGWGGHRVHWRGRWDRAPQRGVGGRGRSRSPAGLTGYVRRPRRAA